VDRSHIITTATGAVALAVAAPVIISMFGLVSTIWPIIPILTASSLLLAGNKTTRQESDANNNTKPKRS
jgi:hypothetical protein